VSFTVDGMIPFRDAALAANGAGDATGVTMDRILRAMTPTSR
jgi:hypothetical protein